MILSAKHGLLLPSQEIAPYDVKLNHISANERADLTKRVRRQAAKLASNVRFSSICGSEYDSLLRDAGVNFQPVEEFALPIGKKLKALTRATDPNKSESDLDALYAVVRRLIEKCGVRPLRESMQETMPSAGLYLFFDENERRLKGNSALRIVRVGTHGVASGSKASLRNRMRTHFGTSAGEGNHRSSIFRLHVGSSIMASKLHPIISSWGQSTTPDKSDESAEKTLEQEVSKYLGRLLVAFVAVPGESEKSNDRAYLEQGLIALLSNSHKPLDPPSYRWLGLTSSKREIRKSGIWNVNHTAQNYEPTFMEILDYYVSLTSGVKPQPSKQLAPADWAKRVRQDARQLSLL